MCIINVILLFALTWTSVERLQTSEVSALYSTKEKTPPPGGEEDDNEELAARSS